MKSLAITIALVFSYLIGTSKGKSIKDLSIRPNILWIVCEDMSPRLSCYGEQNISTPYLDALAKDGIRYTNAYTTAGVCSPSRAGIITAMYPTSIGANNMRNYSEGPQDSQRLMVSGLPSYSVVPPAYVKCFPEFLRKEMYYCTNNAKEDYQFEAPVTAWDESSNKAHWKNRPEGKPFFAVFNLNVTHESQIWKRDSLPLLVNPLKVTIPPYYPDVPEVRHDIARQLSNIVEMDRQAGKLIKELKDAGLYDNTIIFFYSDHGDGLPFVKREITKRGLWIPLIVKLPKSMGAGRVNHQLISAIDFGPTVLSLAGVAIPKYMAGAAFLGLQEEPERKYIYAARDRMDEKVDKVRSVFDGRYQYLKNDMPQLPYYQDLSYRLQIPSMRKIIEMRDNGKLNEVQMRWFKPKVAEELYDTQKDPHQLNNLAKDPNYKHKLKELKEALSNWAIKYDDKNTLTEKELLNQWWFGEDHPPVTAKPELIEVKDGYIINCATPGASIGYIIEPKEGQFKMGTSWKVYHYGSIKLKPGDKIKIKAHRIGYQASEIKYVEN